MAEAEVFTRIGQQVLAPVLAAWAEAVAMRLRAAPDLLPVALMRDGAVLGQAAARVLGRPVTSAWLGRRGCAVAAISGADDHENLLNLLVRMRHRPARWEEAARDLALPPPPASLAAQPLDEATLPDFWEWSARPTVAAALTDHCRMMRAAVLAHLDALPLPGGQPLLLLDVGYAATVQRCLKRILALSGREQAVHGLYLMTSAGARWAMTGAGRVEGVLAALGEPSSVAALLLRHRDVLECLLATAEGELSGYSADGRPQTAPSALSAAQIAQAAMVQNAALTRMADLDGDVATARAALTRLLQEPTPAEAAALGPWRHSDATALEGIRALAAGPADGDRAATLWPAAAHLLARGD